MMIKALVTHALCGGAHVSKVSLWLSCSEQKNARLPTFLENAGSDEGKTYSNPVANSSTIAIRFFVGIRSFHTLRAGRIRMTMSLTMFHRQVIRIMVLLSRHFPGTRSFQIFSRGEQAQVDMHMLMM
jgi:hypothetical protein